MFGRTRTRHPEDRERIRLLRRRGWIVVVCTLLTPVAIYQYTAGLPKSFEAKAVVQPQSTGSASPQSSVQAAAAFVSTRAVTDEAARRLGQPPGSLGGGATAAADPDTGFVTIFTTGPTARRAEAVANAFAAALGSARSKQSQAELDAALNLLRHSLKTTPLNQADQRAELQAKISELDAARQAQNQSIRIVQPAVGARQTSPHPRRNGLIGVLLGFLLGSTLFLLSRQLDRKLRNPEDLTPRTGAAFLGVIPNGAFSEREPSGEVEEAFQTLRASLIYFNVDDDLDSVLVCSALKGEGKSTVALNLARAYASFGKRVILLDTDLRKPDLAGRLGLQQAPGLTNVLVGDRHAEDVLVEVPPYGDALRLLPAGPIPPNPAALLATLRMESLIAELEDECDLLIVDSAPLLVVSDAFPLLEAVSGVLAVARLDRTPWDAIRRTTRIVEAANASLLGYVLGDSAAGRLASYGYGYGYTTRSGYSVDPRPTLLNSRSGAEEIDPQGTSRR